MIHLSSPLAAAAAAAAAIVEELGRSCKCESDYQDGLDDEAYKIGYAFFHRWIW
jgi:hypothetical protein